MSAKDRAVTRGDLTLMDSPKLSFLIKAVYDVLPTPVNLHVWGLTTSDRYGICIKTANLKHILTGCEYARRSFMLRHNDVLEILSEVANICCETANKSLNNITKRTIHFVKERNILSRKNRDRSLLLDGCTEGHVATELDHHFVFPTEIALMTQRLDNVIWSVKLKKKVLLVELTDPFEENFDKIRQLEKYEDLREQCVRNGWKTKVFPIEVGCRGFITNSISVFMSNLGLYPSDKRK